LAIKYPFEDVYTPSISELETSFNTNITTGLSQKEAETRTKEFGANVYTLQKQKSFWLILLLQFKSPIVYLLVAGAAVSMYFNNIIEAAAIVVVICINAIIGFSMELQARSSMNALRAMDIILSQVIRDGKTVQIASEKLTPGDIVLLEAGEVIPADGRLIEINQLQCDESSLTGESIPAQKNIDPLAKNSVLAEQHNMVFKGASVINGNGKMLVTAIAQHTQLGNITALVDTAKATATPLDKKLSDLSKKLIWITLIMTGIFAITCIIQGKPWVLIFETSIALAVAAFPEGLPVVSTVALAYGMLIMAKRNAIVKKLSAVETLGSTSVILTDKTGTLTENKIHADTFSFPEESMQVHIENNELQFDQGKMEHHKENFDCIKLTGALCNNTTIKNTGGTISLLGDAIEISLTNLANTTGTNSEALKTAYPRIAEVPFSAEAKMMATLHKSSKGYFVAAKGSVENLLVKCNSIQRGKLVETLKDEDRKNILAESERLASQGLRVLAFACREGTDINPNNYFQDLIYSGMIGFLDPPRLDIKDALLTCRKAGIKIVMVTGDHPLTALNIAKKTGLVNEDEEQVITGKDLPAIATLTDDWKKRILHTAIFARTTPKQKLEIAGIYQAAGHIVAMTGDGVNDAPALKQADVGIAMGLRGTQVAKETASIVLKDDSFISIAEAVAHGREIFRNIQKFVLYLVSCNLSEIFIVTAVGYFSPASALLPLQILFLNMVTDVFPALALGVGQGDKTVMQNPPRNAAKGIVSNKNWITISIYAALLTLSVIAAVWYCKNYITRDAVTENNVAFITLAFSQLFHVLNMSSRHSGIILNEVTKNKFVWFAIILCTALILLVFYVPQLRQPLHLLVLPGKVWLVCILAAALPLLMVQTYKIIAKLSGSNLKSKVSLK
jgi:Ca2+-transporting ATPase